MMKRYSTNRDANRATCMEHNIRGCNVCNKVVGVCDFGGCHAKARKKVLILRSNGVVGEVRPSCAKHVTFMRQAAPFGTAD